MSTQKAKFELFQRLQNLGFTYEEAVQLRRIEMTLQRWGELECGTGDDRVTRSVERDEETGKPYMRVQYATAQGWHDSRHPVADREAGALKRLAAIVSVRSLAGRPTLQRTTLFMLTTKATREAALCTCSPASN